MTTNPPTETVSDDIEERRLPKVQKKAFNKAKFVSLAKKVRKILEEEKETYQKIEK